MGRAWGGLPMGRAKINFCNSDAFDVKLGEE